MKPSGTIKLVSELLDLPIQDKDGRACGIVDDVELAGSAGEKTIVKALLVGPGAYRGRMPGWAFAVVRAVAGDRMTRVPFAEDRHDRLGREAQMHRDRGRAAPGRESGAAMDSAQGRDVMRLSDLRDKKVTTLDGETVGRVHEVHCDGGRVTALMCGAASLIERLTAKTHGRRIPWEYVRRVDAATSWSRPIGRSARQA